MKINCVIVILFLVVCSSILFVGALDDDGLPIQDEIKHNTSPFDIDTDNDGLSDRDEVTKPNKYPNANPTQKDIYIKVDYTTDVDTDVMNESLISVKEYYSSAPVNNSDDTIGINLHFITANQPIEEDTSIVTMKTYSPSPLLDNSNEDFKVTYLYHKEYGKNQSQLFNTEYYPGYYHLVFTNNLCKNTILSCLDSRITGIAYVGLDGAIVKMRNKTETQATTSHELGHLFGISSSDYEGVDSQNKTIEEYPSAMNYNTKNKMEYSSGTGYDDWEKINNTISNRTVSTDD